MEILGIGLPELFFIVLIALIILGPKDMAKAGKTMGVWLRKLITSDGWRVMQKTTRELKYLPNKLMREAGVEELQQQIKDVKDQASEISALNKWTPDLGKMPNTFETNQIAPPRAPSPDPIQPEPSAKPDPSPEPKP
jgi:sec-independent protein translocase protein TatB